MGKKQDAKSIGKDAEVVISPRRRMVRYSLALVLGGMLLTGWIACLTYSASDWPNTQVWPPPQPTHNYAGLVGAALSHTLFYWLGRGAYMGLLFGSVAVTIIIIGGRMRDMSFRLIGVTLLMASTSTAVFLANPYSPGENLVGAGGILGDAIGLFIQEHFGHLGWLIVLVTALVGLVLAADSIVLKVPRLGKQLWDQRGQLAKVATAISGSGFRVSSNTAIRETAPRNVAAMPRAIAAGGSDVKVLQPPPLARPRVSVADLKKVADAAAANAAAANPAIVPNKSDAAASQTASKEAAAKGAASGEKPAADQKTLADRLKGLVTRTPTAEKPEKAGGFDKPIKTAPVPKPPEPAKVNPPAKPSPKPPGKDSSKEEDKAGYQLPDLSLLIAPEGGYIESQEAQVEIKRSVLQQTLNDFGVEAQVIGHMTGPVITMFECSLAPGVKVSQIAGLSNDIARALAAPGVRIVSPIPNKDTIGIEVPNSQKETVRLRELMELSSDAIRKCNLPLYLGKDAGGDPIVADLSSMPHMLIAGTTGSGKSVCINTIIMSLLMTRSPSEARLILVDPKMVEMAAFENERHLLCPIVNDMRKAESILEWAATKMDERYEVLKEAGVKNIAGYNRLKPEELYARLGAETDEDKARIPLKIPYYVIIIDELADLIMTSSKEVEGHIIRIAQKARAVGIHLILATQRPSVNVVTGLIKSNMPCRISFRVASRQESRIVLDQNGAEVLLGQGDMLFLQPGTSNLSRAQGTFMDDSEIRGVVNFLRRGGEPEFNQELISLRPAGLEGEEGEGGDGSGERDEMFDKAVEIILQTERGSVSLLQRRLGIGYSRASRIVDQMAEAGILGDYKGSQARECLMTLDDWLAFKAGRDADTSGDNSLDGEPTSS